jgi:release factor glutamine methyltransferase
MKISEILKTSPINKLDAEILLAFVIKKNRSFLFTHGEYEPSQIQIKKYKELEFRRLKSEPVAYLINSKEFFSLEFYVNKTTLIPRPETEKIVEIILEKASPESTIIDVGTGSGAISISLKKNKNFKKIYALDICRRALKVAEKNAKNHNVDIEFIQSDLLKNLDQSKLKKPIIFAMNLPYVPQNADLMDDVGLYEPKKALFAGKDGLDLYRKIFTEIKNFDLMLIECNPEQNNEIKNLKNQYFPNKKLYAHDQGRILEISA